MESRHVKKKRVVEIIKVLRQEIPEPKCALFHETPYQLLIATILSAQCTDERVNRVTPPLFARAPDAEAMVRLGLAGIKKFIKTVNFFNNKAANILKASKILVKDHAAQVPRDLESLVRLPGVGRKTANVVLGNAFHQASMVVDTHVIRLSNRLDLVNSLDAIEIEKELEALVPREDWVDFSHLLILHGRQICQALRPQCADCAVQSYCPSRFEEARSWIPTQRARAQR